MKPKEKAVELVQKYLKIEFNVLHTDCEGDRAVATGSCTTMGAKQCALICVDEILNEFSEIVVPGVEFEYITYWNEVKTEIQNL